MSQQITRPQIEENPFLMAVLGWYAIAGCLIFAVSIVIADFVVPDHDWIADTISDLGAGRYEFIVDIGIYAFSGSLIALALLSAHVHLGAWEWSAATVFLAIQGLIVFLIGARNEYGDQDSDGVVIHIYLVYVLGVLMILIPLLMANGVARVEARFRYILIGIAVAWTLAAPVFFFLPDTVDGVYERFLGLIAFALVGMLSYIFIRRGRASR